MLHVLLKDIVHLFAMRRNTNRGVLYGAGQTVHLMAPLKKHTSNLHHLPSWHYCSICWEFLPNFHQSKVLEPREMMSYYHELLPHLYLSPLYWHWNCCRTGLWVLTDICVGIRVPEWCNHLITVHIFSHMYLGSSERLSSLRVGFQSLEDSSSFLFIFFWSIQNSFINFSWPYVILGSNMIIFIS